MAFKKKLVATQVDEVKKEKAVEVASKLTLDTVAAGLAKTQVQIQKTLAAVGSDLSEQLAAFDQVKVAVEAKKAELQNLYGIEAAAVSLEEIKANVVKAQEDYEATVTNYNLAEQELSAEKTKSRKREEDDYSYNLGLRRRKEQSDYEAIFAKRSADLAFKEEAVALREAKIGELEKQVSAFPAQLDKEVKAAVAIATNSQKKDYETQKLLDKAQAETAAQLAAQKILDLQAQLKSKTEEALALKAEVAQARADVNTISAKALESASGRAALDAIQSSNRVSETSQSGRGR
jgi:hypothetical protein